MTNEIINPNDQNSQHVYDLHERTIKFGKQIIDFVKNIPVNNVTKALIQQLIKSGTSIGANYCEADEASSKRDFSHKIGIAKKETKETKYWLRIVVHAVPELKQRATPLWKEAKELNLIFAAIFRNSRSS